MVVARTELCGHIRRDGVNLRGAPGHAFMQTEHIQLGALHHLKPQVVEWLDRCIAGIEVVRPRTEREDFEVLQPHHDPRHVGKMLYIGGHISGQPHGDGRHIGVQTAQPHVQAGIEHAAERIATTADQVRGRFLGRSAEHERPTQPLREDRRRPFRAKIAEVDHGRADFRLFHFGECQQGIVLRFDDG